MQRPSAVPARSLALLLLFAAACQDAPTRLLAPEGPSFAQLPGAPVVNSLADPGDGTCNDSECTLREAIVFAQTGGTITFASTGMIILGGTELLIDKNLTITGPGATSLSVSGNSASRVFHIASGTTASLSGLTITGGATSGNNYGGGIRNEGTLTLENSTVSGNRTSNSGASGGGIYNSGTLMLQNSTVSGNEASANGGGIFNLGGTLTLQNSTISGNSAPNATGVYLYSGALTLRNSTVWTSSGAYAGGIYQYSGTLTLQNSIVTTTNLTADVLVCFGGEFIDDGYNLVRRSQGCGYGSTTRTGLDPVLGALQDNGAPTRTHALLVGSPAINAIPVGSNGCGISTDQRGITRPQGSGCDIGAFEVAPQAQTITFTSTPPALPLVGGSYTVSATASSGLGVSFSSLTPTVCTVSGSTVSLDAAGTCTVAADQAGNTHWLPAQQVTQSFTINQFTLGINASGSLDRKAGVATVGGTLTCSAPVAVTLNVSLTQQQTKGKNTTTVTGSQNVPVSCSGTTAWTADITPTSGKFSGGEANASAGIDGATPAVQTTQAVQLK